MKTTTFERVRRLWTPSVERVSLVAFGAAVAIVIIGQDRVAEILWTQEAAGWVAAIVTLLAVLVALEGPERAHRHAQLLRGAEIERTERERAERAAVLGHVFHVELYRAAMVLDNMISSTSSSSLDANPHAGIATLIGAQREDKLPLMRRLAVDLVGFSAADANAILICLSNWAAFQMPAPRGLYNADPAQIREVSQNMHLVGIRFQRMALELQLRLERYFEGYVALAAGPRIVVWTPPQQFSDDHAAASSNAQVHLVE